MARTKQTARKCLVRQAATKGPKTKGVRKPHRFKPGAVDSQSQDELEQVNNQQFSVKFDDQAHCEQNSVTGAIVACSNCEAVFTSQSKSYSKAEYFKLQQNPTLSDQQKQKYLKNYDLVWICQFCLTHNSIAKSYKVPQTQNPCFLIQKKKKSTKNSSKIEEDDENKILIFCIDISGSMDLKVAGSKSRLDTVKEAIIDEINRMNVENQVIKVGLVTFGSWVQLIGDGKTFKEEKLDSAIYDDFDKIVKQCNKISKFASPIKKSYEALKKRVQNLGVYGSTALGPGLLSSIQIASKGGIGSKVIICTDGQANVGIGSMFGNSGQQSKFYEKAANFAKEKRVSVSILSLKGDRCNLKELGKLSLATGGSILKIDPAALGTQFAKIAKQQILGTESHLVIKVNKIFEIISHVPNQLSADKTTLTQEFGNFSSQTQLTFEFKVLTKEEASKKAGIDIELYNQPRVPMQIQLTYVGRDGNKYKQIITDWRQLTENQKQVYDGANFGLFAASVLQRASSKIKSAEFNEAQNIVKGYWSLVQEKFSKTQKAQQLTKFNDRVKKIETILNSKLRKSGKVIRNSSIKVSKQQKTKKVLKKATKKSPKTNAKKRSRKRSVSKCSSSESDNDSEASGMSSDEEEQILYKQMRARSRSNSPQVDKKTKKVKK